MDENDNAPKFSRIIKAEIIETAQIGDFITQISAFDPDINQTALEYSIEGDGAENFLIDTLSGNITLAQLLDFEKVFFYLFF